MDRGVQALENVLKSKEEQRLKLEEENNKIDEQIEEKRKELEGILEEDLKKIDEEIKPLDLELQNLSMELFDLLSKRETAERRTGVPAAIKNPAIAGYDRLIKEKGEEIKSVTAKINHLKEEKDDKAKKLEEEVASFSEGKQKARESLLNRIRMADDAIADYEIRIASASERANDNVRKSLEEEQLKYKEMDLITQFISSQGPGSDIYNDYSMNKDLMAIKRKYAAEFDEFVKNSTKTPEPVEPQKNDNDSQKYMSVAEAAKLYDDELERVKTLDDKGKKEAIEKDVLSPQDKFDLFMSIEDDNVKKAILDNKNNIKMFHRVQNSLHVLVDSITDDSIKKAMIDNRENYDLNVNDCAYIAENMQNDNIKKEIVKDFKKYDFSGLDICDILLTVKDDRFKQEVIDNAETYGLNSYDIRSIKMSMEVVENHSDDNEPLTADMYFIREDQELARIQELSSDKEKMDQLKDNKILSPFKKAEVILSMKKESSKIDAIKNFKDYDLNSTGIRDILLTVKDDGFKQEVVDHAKDYSLNDEDVDRVKSTIAKTKGARENNDGDNSVKVDYETQSGSVPESSPEVPEVPVEEVNSAVIDGNTMAVVRSKVIAIKDGVNSRIRELVDTKGGRKLAATLGTLGLAAVVLTGPVGGTVLGTIAAGVGSTAFIGGGGVLTAAAVKEFEKGRKL